MAGQSIGDFKGAYIEPAPFRDGWKLLKEDERCELIRDLCSWADPTVDASYILEMRDSKNHIRSPASWKVVEISNSSKNLLKIYWMYRARPDVLVVTESAAIWTELKVESPNPAARSDGYNQYETQCDIANRAKVLVGSLRNKHPINITIQRGTDNSWGKYALTWKEIVSPDWNHFTRLFLAGKVPSH